MTTYAVFTTPAPEATKRMRALVDAIRSQWGSEDRIVVVGQTAVRDATRITVTTELPALDDAVIVMTDDVIPATRGWSSLLIDALTDAHPVAVPLSARAPLGHRARWAPSSSERPAVVRRFAESLSGDIRDVSAAAGPMLAVLASRAKTLVGCRSLDEVLARVASLPARVHDRCYAHCVTTEPTIGAALIVKNEMQFIDACIDSLRGRVHEIIVYDTGSTDGTVEHLRRRGIEVIEGHWDDDFARARNEALAACCAKWVLSIDADEVIEGTDDEWTAMYQGLAGTGTDRYHFMSLRLVNLEGSEIAPVRREAPVMVPRLLRRAAVSWKGRLHEQPTPVDGRPVLTADCSTLMLVHHGYLAEVQAGRDKDARNAHIATVGLDETDARSLFDLGRSLAKTDPLGAIERYRQAIDVGGNHVFERAAREYLANMLILTGEHAEALTVARDLLARNDGPDGPARLAIARASLSLGDAAEAVAQLDAIEKLNDRFSINSEDSVAELRALALQRLGRSGDAADDLVRLAIANPGVMSTWRSLAELAVDRPDAWSAAIGAVPRAELRRILPSLMAASPRAAAIALDATWQVHGENVECYATAAETLARFEVDDRNLWTARLRAAGLSVAPQLATIWSDPSRTAADRGAALLDAVEDPIEPDPDAIIATLDTLLDAGESATAAALFGWSIATALERAGDADIELRSLSADTVERIASVAEGVGRADVANLATALLAG
jgi:tetratricopeptide (TPR) repeat protein